MRRFGLLGVASLTTMTYLGSSASGSPVPSKGSRILSSRVPTVAHAVPEDVEGDGDGIWVVLDATSRSIRAIREAQPATPGVGEGDQRVVAVTAVVGRHHPRPVITNAITPEDLLRAMHVDVQDTDVVRPRKVAFLVQGDRVRYVKLRVIEVSVAEEAPFTTLTRYTSDLAEGDSQVLTPGRPGQVLRTYRLTYRNGVEVERVLVSEEVLADPIEQVVLEGTAPSPAAGPVPVPTDNVQYGQATWYDFCPTPGMYAAHKTLPFGTVVTVTNLDNGRSVAVTINDRGPYGPGRIIDLCPEAFEQIAALGQGVANVRITW